MQYSIAIHNISYAICNIAYAIYNISYAICNIAYAIYNIAPKSNSKEIKLRNYKTHIKLCYFGYVGYRNRKTHITLGYFNDVGYLMMSWFGFMGWGLVWEWGGPKIIK